MSNSLFKPKKKPQQLPCVALKMCCVCFGTASSQTFFFSCTLINCACILSSVIRQALQSLLIWNDWTGNKSYKLQRSCWEYLKLRGSLLCERLCQWNCSRHLESIFSTINCEAGNPKSMCCTFEGSPNTLIYTKSGATIAISSLFKFNKEKSNRKQTVLSLWLVFLILCSVNHHT